jgi:hypothetical protein
VAVREAAEFERQFVTSTALSASPTAVVIGQPNTLTATVTVASPGTGTPIGSVTFFDGTTPLGTAALSGGVATLAHRFTSLGAHSITAA